MPQQDITKMTELTQQLLQAPLNNLALFIAVLALFVLLGSMFIIYRLAPRIVVFLESLTNSYSKMVENLEKLTDVETQSAATQAHVTNVVTDLNDNFGTLLTKGSVPVQRIDDATQKVLTAVAIIETKLNDIQQVTSGLSSLPEQNAEIASLMKQVRGYMERLSLKATREMQTVNIEVAATATDNGESKNSKETNE